LNADDFDPAVEEVLLAPLQYSGSPKAAQSPRKESPGQLFAYALQNSLVDRTVLQRKRSSLFISLLNERGTGLIRNRAR
jgi:hypothetical protein